MSQIPVLMGHCNLPDICWQGSEVSVKQSKFLKGVRDHITIWAAIQLDLLFINKGEEVVDVIISGWLVCREHDIAECL